MRLGAVAVVVALLAPAGSAAAAAEPRYDVPDGFTRCPDAIAWNGFFKWASVHGSTCRTAARFVRTYAAAAQDGMPRRVRGYGCRIRYWRNEDGDIYASRHVCARGNVMIRFYGMV